jgi:RyR domain
MMHDQIARVAHEVNRAYCESIGDRSQPAWESAPDWQRKSAVHGVYFHCQNPDASPSASHDNWLKDKLADGWKYGPVKDPEQKKHPCCVPYDQLPQEQRSKDFLFRAVVHALKDGT